MSETMPTQRYYFRKTDPTDQAFHRLLMRYRGDARTALFREIVLGGYLRYVKKQDMLRRRAKKPNGSPSEVQQPVHTTAPAPWIT